MADDDMGFGTSNASSKSRNVKTGRRARKSSPDAATGNGYTAQVSETMLSPEKAGKSTPDKNDTDGPPRPSRVSGWGEDKKGRSRNLGEGFENIEDERLRPRSAEKGEDSDSDNAEDADIPVIPDLEDQQDDDMTTSVAMAPNIAVNRVATYRELDNDLLRQAAFLTLDNDIDLKILTRSLCGEADLLEEDKPWTWDLLFTEVTSELLTQWESEDPEADQGA